MNTRKSIEAVVNGLPIENAPADWRRKRLVRDLGTIGCSLNTPENAPNVRAIGLFLQALAQYADSPTPHEREMARDIALMALEDM